MNVRIFLLSLCTVFATNSMFAATRSEEEVPLEQAREKAKEKKERDQMRARWEALQSLRTKKLKERSPLLIELQDTQWRWAPRASLLICGLLYLHSQREYSKSGAVSSFYPRLDRAGLSLTVDKLNEQIEKINEILKLVTDEKHAKFTQQLERTITERDRVSEELARVEKHLQKLEDTRSWANTKRWAFGIGALVSATISLWSTLSSSNPSQQEIEFAAAEILEKEEKKQK